MFNCNTQPDIQMRFDRSTCMILIIKKRGLIMFFVGGRKPSSDQIKFS